jgi:hypothetical protein
MSFTQSCVENKKTLCSTSNGQKKKRLNKNIDRWDKDAEQTNLYNLETIRKERCIY